MKLAIVRHVHRIAQPRRLREGSFVQVKGGDLRATAIQDALLMAYHETPADGERELAA